MNSYSHNNNTLHKAVTSFNNKNYDDSILHCKILLKIKKSPQILHLIGLSYLAKGIFEESIKYIEEAITFDPSKSIYYIDLSEAYKLKKDYKKALQLCEKAISIDSSNHKAYFCAATNFQLMKIYPSAFKMAISALTLDDNNFKYKHFIAKCLIDLQKFNEALEIYNNLLIENCNSTSVLLDKSELLRMMFRYEEALSTAELAFSLDENNTNCYIIKSVILREMNKPHDAIVELNKCLIIKPESQLANFNKGVMLLALGDFANGWDLYEWRLKSNDLTPRLNLYNKALWNKEKDCTLLLWQEQGIGDEVMFASIFNELKYDVSKLIVKIDSRLIEIFERSFTGIKFISSQDFIPDTDYTHHLPIGSLPKFYRRSKLKFKGKNSAYLITNPQLNHDLSRYFTNRSKRIIGISWISTNPLSGLKRSTALEDLIKYIDDYDAIFVNLQYGDVDDELLKVQNKLNIKIINIKEINNKQNIDGLFSIIHNCDEVISIDNSTVHFAGSIGKKTEVLLHKSADYRWELNNPNSNWYQSLKLTRDILM